MKLEDITDSEVQQQIREGMGLRKAALQLKAEADDMKKRADAILEPAILTLAGDTFSVEQVGLGTVVFALPYGRKVLDKVKFRKELALKGVNADIIAGAEKKATTITPIASSVRFSLWKEPK